MRCKGMKLKIKKSKVSCYGCTVYKDREVSVNCGKQATHFFRVRYGSLRAYRENGISEEVLGFCEECARDKHAPAGYNSPDRDWRSRKVLHLRGIVAHVEREQDGGEAAVESARIIRLNDVKQQFLRIMTTKGNRDIANDWPEVFRLAWEEFQIRAVMEK